MPHFDLKEKVLAAIVVLPVHLLLLTPASLGGDVNPDEQVLVADWKLSTKGAGKDRRFCAFSSIGDGSAILAVHEESTANERPTTRSFWSIGLGREITGKAESDGSVDAQVGSISWFRCRASNYRPGSTLIAQIPLNGGAVTVQEVAANAESLSTMVLHGLKFSRLEKLHPVSENRFLLIGKYSSAAAAVLFQSDGKIIWKNYEERKSSYCYTDVDRLDNETVILAEVVPPEAANGKTGSVAVMKVSLADGEKHESVWLPGRDGRVACGSRGTVFVAADESTEFDGKHRLSALSPSLDVLWQVELPRSSMTQDAHLLAAPDGGCFVVRRLAKKLSILRYSADGVQMLNGVYPLRAHLIGFHSQAALIGDQLVVITEEFSGLSHPREGFMLGFDVSKLAN